MITKGKLDSIAISDVLRFERELLDHLHRNTEILTTLRETNVLDEKTEGELEKAIDSFLEEFQGGGADGVQAGSEEFDETEEADINQEKIVRRKR